MSNHASDHHAVSRSAYFAVFAALMILTVITVYAAFIDMGQLNTIVAMTIACAKALLVVLYFMHARHAGKLIWVMLGSGILWLAILLVLTMMDYASRGWLPFPGK
jgi:cytochrome c oxidase subunit 4